MPMAQVRDMTIHKRENDLVMATFGRGFYILDDYSALREITPKALTEDARLFPLRDAYMFNTTGIAPPGTAGLGPLAGNWTAANPPYGAVFTYHVKQALPESEKLVLTIADDTGRQVRRLEIDKAAGLRRVAWNLRMDPPAAPQGGAARQGGPPVTPGRYTATLGRLAGDKVTAIGPAQRFHVTPIQ
jgi:hypothetical protein